MHCRRNIEVEQAFVALKKANEVMLRPGCQSGQRTKFGAVLCVTKAEGTTRVLLRKQVACASPNWNSDSSELQENRFSGSAQTMLTQENVAQL